MIAAAVEENDVFLQASTSFGKSLCFQLPAVVSHGGWLSNSLMIAGFLAEMCPDRIVTIVVSPLLALMVSITYAVHSVVGID